MSKTTTLARLRNIGVAAHVDAGKTTLTERILFYTGASHKIGEVHAGAAHMDYLAEEQLHGITITSAVTKAPWRGHLLQVVDTPGHVDFTIEVERSMRILDGCILVLDGVRGVEPQTETIWRQRSRFNLPAIFFINKMDRPGADFDRALGDIAKRLKAEPVAITVPIPDQGGVVHLIDRTLIRFAGEQGEILDCVPCPAELWSECAPWREALLLAVADLDDALAEQVLAGAEPDPAEIRRALRSGTLTGRLFPTYGGSALRNLGVQPLLDGVIEFLPAPPDRPPALAHRADGTTEEVVLGDQGPLVALAFKVQLWDGRRHVFARIYRNRLRPGDRVVHLASDGRIVQEQIARLFDIDAGKKTKTDEAGPGEIVLIAGLRHAATGDTLCAPDHPLALERIDARRPVLSLAIEPVHGEDTDKLLDVLDKLNQEDPTLTVEEDPETGQRLLRGMGELHLQIVLERLAREFSLEVRCGRPAVATRETIRATAHGDALYAPPPSPDPKVPERRARVAVRLAPLARGNGVRIGGEPRIRPEGGELGPVQRTAVADGLSLALTAGPLQGAPLEDLEVVLEEVELFGQASTPEALSAASARAVQKALATAHPALLHPVMAVEVVVPETNLGTVLGDLQARQATIRDTASRDEDATIVGEVPLEQLLGYTTALRSLTQGRGQFSMQFERFDLV
ncbi:small GTP-binding protein domain protein [Thioflavicoccus mobilis 8321]|uniref:Small GTP-binding protein domain protein n=1 Tax=Thioflavicoccus mobilis 8321 TaxID=765912 RepID=L0GUM9_9GAMM|nr:elongation factor G [Thioflavicoccus mobilis]AGA90463.1 small GTP-binding protein domain protein [Thioflavicoccus mobilis 8321]